MRRVTILGLFLLTLSGCASRSGGQTYLERIRVDLGEAAHGFSDGRLNGRQYLALARDRAGKARLYEEDTGWKSAASGGDRDGDRVPDSLDACRDTPPLTATDRRGCPLVVPAPDPDLDRRTRDLQDRVAFLLDPRCDGSPLPQTPQPLEWGRDSGGSFNLAVTRVDNQKPGCTLFYEMQFRIPLGSSDFLNFNVLYNASEDLSPGHPRRAVFALPLNAPLLSQRTALRNRLNHFAGELQWRVRAVNGAGGVSSWSTPRTLGPASSGVTP